MDIVFFGPKGDYAGIYSTGSTERLKGLYKLRGRNQAHQLPGFGSL